MRKCIFPVTVLVLAILVMYTGCMKSNQKSNHTLPWLHTQGNRIVNADDEPVMLCGVNRSGLEYNKRGEGISLEEVTYIRNNWKAQIIRLPFNQDWITNDMSYEAYFDTVIGWVNNNDMYAMLDLQWENTKVRIPKIPNIESVDMWKMLATKYKDNPGVLYDIHNEAHDTTWDAWRERASQIIEGIQSVHPKALIFVSGLDWAYDLRGWQEQPLPYDNIVYSTHPYFFKGEPWAWDEYFGDFSETRPVFAGEFGGGKDNLEWGSKLLDYFAQKQIGWTAWSWQDQPHLTLDDRRTPTEFGELVKQALIKHAAADGM